MWAIGVKFLRGVCVATDRSQWNQPEWPPHPARLHMALAASYFETLDPSGNSASEDQRRRALEWLEQQPPPRVFATEASTRLANGESVGVTVYVPVNDSTRADQLFPEKRSRQPRHFPTSIPECEDVYFVWDVELPSDVAQGMQEIAFNVTRIGHSSSLVQVWIDENFEQSNDRLVEEADFDHWLPSDGTDRATTKLRVVADSEGTLASYEASFNLKAVEEFADLHTAVSEAKGKVKSSLRKELTERFPDGMPASLEPPRAMSVNYRREREPNREPMRSYFDDDLMVLCIHDGPRIGLESTLQLSGAFRKRIHDAFSDRKSPEWLGGHKSDGSRTDRPHMAIVPLAYVGAKHADGHLLGIALAFPRDVAHRDRALALRGIFERDRDGEFFATVNLKHFRRLTDSNSADCPIQFAREQRLTPPKALQPETWTSCSTVWETVTPIALDRFPKRDRIKERASWNKEVAGIIASSCTNIGLPEPAEVVVHHNAFGTGIPKALPKGSGFPLMNARGGKATRYQVHARIRFTVPVVGPVILGAGRFVGYGFCRPNHSECRNWRAPR